MLTLALESSGPRRSVALCEWTARGAYRVLGQASGKAGRNGPLASLVGVVLRQAELVPGRVERLAVGAGPGSLAGIRSAMAFATGWSAAWGIPAVGVPAVLELAAQASLLGCRGRLLCLMNHRDRRWHGAVMDLDGTGIREEQGLAPLSREEAESLSRKCQAAIGLELPPFRLPQPAHAVGHSAEALGWAAAPGREGMMLPLEPLFLEQPAFARIDSGRNRT